MTANTAIRSVAVLGAGTMGAQIAAHFANAGVPAILLDLNADVAREGLKRARALKPDVKNGSGLSVRARSSPCLAASALTSRSNDGTPALAKWAAIWAPMVPAPSTATDRIAVIRVLSWCRASARPGR